jgi:thymidylate synthase (FAD)
MGQILVELQEFMGNDRSIANSAWTSSFDKDKRDARSDEQVCDLVKRLAKEGHSTPFESVIFRFWIRMPIFVDRQHMTHRIASHNGLSGRYRTMPTDYYDLPDDVESILNKVDLRCYKSNPNQPERSIYSEYYESCEIANNNYRYAIDSMKKAEKDGAITNQEFKRAREVLRGQLPTAGMVERTTIMNLRSFANYQKLRNSSHAQPEIKTVAELMLKSVVESNICPVALEALKEKCWNI